MTVLGDDVATAPMQCPTCGKLLDRATAFGREGFVKPKIGDLGMCIRCLGWHEWIAADLARFVNLHYVMQGCEGDEQRRDIIAAITAGLETHWRRIREGKRRIVETDR
jgi:hypothetical protein